MNKLAANYQLLEPSILPGGSASVTFATYFKGLTTTIFAVATVLAVLMIVVGGVQYILSDIVTSKQEAKNRIINAITGLFILICIALILTVINPELLKLDAFLGNLSQ